MSKILKKIVLKLIKISHPLLDLVTTIVVILSSPFLKYFVMFGAKNNPISTSIFKKFGFFVINDHFYQPLFNDKDLKNELFYKRNLPGIDFNVETQLDFLNKLQFAPDLIDLKMETGFYIDSLKTIRFELNNSSYIEGDAEFLYQFIRQVKPKKIIEIGAGNSTKIIYKANSDNNLLDSVSHTTIEPYWQPWLESLENVDVIRSSVEEIDISIFKTLNEGDFLFIDSSHIIRPQGDVLYEILEILPSLNPGVFVHFHDVFTPNDYPEEWIRKDVRFWNEQYLLEALLTNTNNYEIVAALNYLHTYHYSELKEVCPYLKPSSKPGAIYIQIKNHLG